jgi:acetolactate synthase-1/2/3 large subunit
MRPRTQPATATGGKLLAAALRQHAVELIFCVPGESYLALLDALYDLRSTLSVISCRHEHGAAVMAEAHAKLTGRPGVCLVTRGPGACNAAIAVHTAFQDSTPMVLLIGQVPRPFLGREAFQEVDLVRMFSPLAKQAVQVSAAGEIPVAISWAFGVALSGRQGPVVVALPEDVLSDTAAVPPAMPITAGEPLIDPDSMVQLRRLLGEAARPLLIVGGGGWTARARTDIVAFAAANDLPACCTFRRHDIFDNAHPNFVGELGIGPDPALTARVRAADLLIAVGTRLGEIPTQGYTLIPPSGGPALVHVHPAARELGRVIRPTLAIVSGAAAFAATARGIAPTDAGRRRAWTRQAREDYQRNREVTPGDRALDLAVAMSELDRRLPEPAVITVDAGNFSGWPQRYLTFGGGRRLLGAANGAMGYGVPAAVAAKIAAPERTVIACVGDGGFGMTGQELATAVKHGVAPIVLVFNNAMYGTIRMHQERRFPGRVIATDLANPDFAALARAHGAHGETVARTEEFAPALDRAIAAGTAALIELRMDPDAITTRTTLSAIRRSERPAEPG